MFASLRKAANFPFERTSSAAFTVRMFKLYWHEERSV